MEKKYKIIEGNCLEELKKIEDNFVNCVITSPPYNMNLRINKGRYCSRQIVKEFSTKYDGFDDNLPIEEYFQFHKQVIEELMRISSGNVFYNIQCVTGNKPALFRLLGEFYENVKEVIIWNKINGQPAMQNGVMNSCFEFIFVFNKDKKEAMKRQFDIFNFGRGTLNNIWDIKKKPSKDKNHAATFPLELIDKIILNFTKENDLILDPFSGTATTGESALKNNRRYIGIELLGKYVAFSLKRLKNI
ncbi:MAG: DNA-methyltransferase [Mycoplasma sp.]